MRLNLSSRVTHLLLKYAWVTRGLAIVFPWLISLYVCSVLRWSYAGHIKNYQYQVVRVNIKI